MDRLLHAFERLDQIATDLRALAWTIACAAYLAARERTCR